MTESVGNESIDCSRPPSPALLKGIRQFNAGEYYACHETLEELWLAEPGAVRRLYQGILQIGVGLHHLQQGNGRGASLLLARGAQLLRPFAPTCQKIDVSDLLQGAGEVARLLDSCGPEATRSLGRAILPRIRLVGEING